MRQVISLIILVLVLLVLPAGCGTDPSARAGVWNGSTQHGDFTFYISDDGTAIEDVEYSFQCGINWINSSNLIMDDPHPLESSDLNFTVSLAGQLPLAEWTGKFSADGKTLSGQLSLFAGSCVTDFEINR